MSVDQSIRPSRLLLFGFHICSLTVKQQIERQNMVLWLLTSSVSLLWPVVGGKKSCYTITDHHHHLHTAIPIPSQYIFSILVFVNGNSDLFQLNSEIHDLNTRYNCNLHLPSTQLTLVQKGVHYSGNKIYNRSFEIFAVFRM
jgi:hypothetical protein